MHRRPVSVRCSEPMDLNLLTWVRDHVPGEADWRGWWLRVVEERLVLGRELDLERVVELSDDSIGVPGLSPFLQWWQDQPAEGLASAASSASCRWSPLVES